MSVFVLYCVHDYAGCSQPLGVFASLDAAIMAAADVLACDEVCVSECVVGGGVGKEVWSERR
jgi:hypothetical protein